MVSPKVRTLLVVLGVVQEIQMSLMGAAMMMKMAFSLPFHYRGFERPVLV